MIILGWFEDNAVFLAPVESDSCDYAASLATCAAKEGKAVSRVNREFSVCENFFAVGAGSTSCRNRNLRI